MSESVLEEKKKKKRRKREREGEQAVGMNQWPLFAAKNPGI